MNDYAWIIIVISIFILWGIISWIRETISNSKKYLKLKPKLDVLESSIQAHELKIAKDSADLELREKKKSEEHEFKVEKDRSDWVLRVKQWNEKIQQDALPPV